MDAIAFLRILGLVGAAVSESRQCSVVRADSSSLSDNGRPTGRTTAMATRIGRLPPDPKFDLVQPG